MNGGGKKLQINGFEKLTYKQNCWLDKNWKIIRTFVKDTESIMGPTFEVDDGQPLEYPTYGIVLEHQNKRIPNVIQININSEIKSGHILLPYVEIEVEHVVITPSIHNTTLAIEMFYDMDTFKKHLLDMIEKVTTI